MNPEVRDMWRAYFCRASTWAEINTGGMYDVAIEFLTDLKVGDTFSEIGKPVFTRSSIHDTDSVADFLNNPDKCVKNPYVNGAMKHTPDLDAAWIKTIVRKRSDNYDAVAATIDDSAKELHDTVKPCYDLMDGLQTLNTILSGVD